MLAFEEALARITAEMPAPSHETVPLTAACGRILADHIRSPIDLPSFDNSAMDGYAVRSADVASAKAESPVRLSLAGRVAAGEVWPTAVAPGTCVRLFAGSPLPPGADAVVMQEDTRIQAGATGGVLVLDRAEPGENVRAVGKDVRQGMMLVEAGEVLSPGRIGLLAAAGFGHVPVGRQPVVGLVATGSELIEPEMPLAHGRIYESNRAALAALMQRVGAIPKTFSIVADTLAGTAQALLHAFNKCDAVVTCGGVSVGDMDFLKPALEQIDGKLEFWQVAMKPGRPFAFGHLQEKPIFGLPGNPVSAFVTFLLLVRPALLRWQGAKDLCLPSHPGVLAEPLANPGERRHFMRVRVSSGGDIHSAGLQASHALSSLACANGLVDVPPNTTLVAGTKAPVLRWES